MRKLEKFLTGTAVAVVLSMTSAPIAFAGFDEAVTAYEQGDYKKAHAEWLPLAEADDPAAMRNIGHLYRRGLGLEKDFSKALGWYKRAANMGFDRAQANVGTMYLKGQGVETNYTEAAKWFTKAARNGHTIAQYNLGLMYEHGKGVEKSKTKAIAWYNLASKAGHKQALNKLSILVASEPDIKVTPDADDAVRLTPVDVAAPKTSVEEKIVVAAKPAPTPIVKPSSVTTKQVTPEPVATMKPAEVKTVQPEPVIKETPAPVKVVSSKEDVVTTPVAEPEIKTPVNKFDPFAGSANNVQPAGEATVFSKPDTQLKTGPVDATVATADAKKPEVEEEKGFFAALKSLVSGDDAEEKETESSVSDGVVAGAAIAGTTASATTDSVATPKVGEGHVAPVGNNSVAVAAKPVSVPKQNSVASIPAQQSAVVPKASAASPAVRGSLSLAEQLEMAELAFSLEEYQQALSVWAPLAQNGNAEAQYNLGVMFNEGHAVPVDRVRAYFWWDKATKSGNQTAAQSLAKLEKTLTFLEKRQLQSVN